MVEVFRGNGGGCGVRAPGDVHDGPFSRRWLVPGVVWRPGPRVPRLRGVRHCAPSHHESQGPCRPPPSPSPRRTKPSRCGLRDRCGPPRKGARTRLPCSGSRRGGAGSVWLLPSSGGPRRPFPLIHDPCPLERARPVDQQMGCSSMLKTALRVLAATSLAAASLTIAAPADATVQRATATAPVPRPRYRTLWAGRAVPFLGLVAHHHLPVHLPGHRACGGGRELAVARRHQHPLTGRHPGQSAAALRRRLHAVCRAITRRNS